jgi:hypothetical protein
MFHAFSASEIFRSDGKHVLENKRIETVQDGDRVMTRVQDFTKPNRLKQDPKRWLVQQLQHATQSGKLDREPDESDESSESDSDDSESSDDQDDQDDGQDDGKSKKSFSDMDKLSKKARGILLDVTRRRYRDA